MITMTTFAMITFVALETNKNMKVITTTKQRDDGGDDNDNDNDNNIQNFYSKALNKTIIYLNNTLGDDLINLGVKQVNVDLLNLLNLFLI